MNNYKAWLKGLKAGDDVVIHNLRSGQKRQDTISTRTYNGWLFVQGFGHFNSETGYLRNSADNWKLEQP